MDMATLRRLLADRDSAALSEDVIALLDAHARVSPAVRSEMDAYLAVVRAARDAMNSSQPSSLPAFPRSALAAALKATPEPVMFSFRIRNRMMGLAAAACVVFAFFAGRISNMSDPTQGERQDQVAMDVPAPRASIGIWSLDANRRPSRSEIMSSESHIKWNSPLELSVTRRS